MERPDCRRGETHTNPEKKAAAQHPKTPMRIYIVPGTYKPTAQTAKQKKYIQKETEKENRGNTTHHPHTKKKRRRGEKKMEWEETDTLVHFYEDQDGNLYLRLPGGNLRRVREERQERLRKSLKEIGYQPTPIKVNKTPQTTQNTPTKNLTRLLQEAGPRRLPLPSGAVITIYTEDQELKATLIEEGIITELRGPQEILEIIIHHSEGW